MMSTDISAMCDAGCDVHPAQVTHLIGMPTGAAAVPWRERFIERGSKPLRCDALM